MQNQSHKGHRERLRANYASQGGDALLDHQYLELLLTYAIPRRDTNEIAHALLDRFGTLENILRAEVAALMLVDGVGENTAVFLRMTGDLENRLALKRLSNEHGTVYLKTPYSAAVYARTLLSREGYERVKIVFLDSRKKVLSNETLSLGTLTEAQVYPRMVAERALLKRAHSVMLLHNHPSGDPTPSQADKDTTVSVRTTLDSVAVKLIDHLIVGGFYVFSFSTNAVIDLTRAEPTAITLEDYQAVKSRASLKIVTESYDE